LYPKDEGRIAIDNPRENFRSAAPRILDGQQQEQQARAEEADRSAEDDRVAEASATMPPIRGRRWR
jgi:hypothetical protein